MDGKKYKVFNIDKKKEERRDYEFNDSNNRSETDKYRWNKMGKKNLIFHLNRLTFFKFCCSFLAMSVEIHGISGAWSWFSAVGVDIWKNFGKNPTEESQGMLQESRLKKDADWMDSIDSQVGLVVDARTHGVQ